MFRTLKFIFGLGMLAPFLISGTQSHASSISDTYTGTLTSESGAPGSVVLEGFTLTSASDVTIFTTSYGGGMNLDGTVTGPGGFQPNVTLYNSAGFVLENQSPSFSPIGNTDPSTGLNLDSYLEEADLSAGLYYVSLTDWQNQMSIFSSGLDLSTADYLQFSGPGGTSFQDVDGNTRTGNYALDISATPVGGTAATPEPSTLFLLIPGIVGVGLMRIRPALGA